MKLSIVIPCYNEAQTIRTLVDRVRASAIKDKEIIIVDEILTFRFVVAALQLDAEPHFTTAA